MSSTRPEEVGTNSFQGSVADQRSAFRHAVTYVEREFDAVEELFHFRVHCGSSDNHFFEPAAQCVHQFLADLSVYLSVQQRDAEGPFHGLFVDDGLNDILVYLFR